MEVAVTALRAELSHWIQRVRDGDEVTVTDRGVPVARLTAIDSASRLEKLVREGVLSKTENLVRPSAADIERVPARESVSELVALQRMSRGA